MKTFTRLMFVVSAIVVAGCSELPGSSLGATYDVDRYLKTERTGTGFNGALAKEYTKIARRAAFKDVRWYNATAYIAKARAAESGKTPAPWSPEQLGIGGNAVAEYKAVVAAVNAGKSAHPAECARAQAMWDQYLEALRGGEKYCIAPADAKALLDKALAACAVPNNYTVFFGFDRSDLTAQASRIIDEVVDTVKSMDDVALSIVGHTDTVGTASYNQALSVRRARRVADALVERDIPSGSMTLAGRGFRELAVPTGLDVREPKNRRVEITLSK